MEQKQIDDEESFFGDEFVEEDVQLEEKEEAVAEEEEKRKEKEEKVPVKEKKKSSSRKTKAAKRAAKKSASLTKSLTEPNPGDADPKDADEGAGLDNEDEQKAADKEKEDIQITPASNPAPADKDSPVDPWNEDDDSEDGAFKGSSTWKLISGILIVLLVASVYTNGFAISGAATTVAELSLAEAESKVLDFVNNNLLQPPFVAELESSEDAGSLYKLTLTVAGQAVESYLTKDGELFFPQGFKVAEGFSGSASTEEKLDVYVDDDAVKGSDEAPVTIIEFSDYECPFCSKYVRETYPQIIKNYVESGKVKYVFRDFPLGFHPNAQKAAEAAECAGEQGKFWEMHDYLFENQDYLSVENLKGYAKDLQLDTELFDRCLDNNEMAEEVLNDLADGQSYGVSGTPGFFINGKLVSGAQPYFVFEKEIEAALAAAEGSGEEVTEVPTVNEGELDGVPTEAVVDEEETPVEEEVAPPVVEEPKETVKEFTLTAKKWLFTPSKLTVNEGDSVKLIVESKGLDFTFALPQFGIKEEVSGSTAVEFVADKAGKFEYKCSSCEEWRGMTGTLVVE